MASFSNTPFAKRLRAAKTHDTEDGAPKRSRSRTNTLFGAHVPSTPSLDSFPGTSESGVSDATATAKDYGDRFVPSRDSGDLRASFHLLEDKSPSTSTKKLIPTESDALKEQANSIFTTLLHTEVAPSSPVRASSPVRQSSGIAPPSTPTRRRLFNFNTPSKSNPGTPDRRMDTPNDEAYSMSPVRQESRQLLESPRRKLRSVCKTPYRVLDAPELADDFYLNLVDWSSTNVLSVGLGSCVYLWTAHTAAVSKLCDLSDASDTVSSVSWVQKVCSILSRRKDRLLTFTSGLVIGHWNVIRANVYLRRIHFAAHTDIPYGSYKPNRCPLLEWACVDIRFSRQDDLPPRRA